MLEFFKNLKIKERAKKIFAFSLCIIRFFVRKIYIFGWFKALIVVSLLLGIFLRERLVNGILKICNYLRFFTDLDKGKSEHRVLVLGLLVLVFLLFYRHIISIYNRIDKCLLDFSKGKGDGSDGDKGYNDKPITDKKDDLLHSDKRVDKFVKLIEENGNNKCFSILIDAEWGEGKTSFFELAWLEIEKNNRCAWCKEIFRTKPLYEIFRFNPWLLSTDRPILDSFFEELGKIDVFKNKLKLFSDLKNILSGQTIGGFKMPNLKASKSFERLKKEIVDVLQLENRKLLIFIDDIDRLTQTEKILEVLKLVGEFQSLSRIVFVLAFDRKVVENRLIDQTKTDRHYLEKIINHTYPVINSPQDVTEYFKNKLELLVDKGCLRDLGLFWAIQPKDEDLKFIPNSNYNYDLFFKFKTLRQVKIFIYDFQQIYREIENDVCFFDFFWLRILKNFYIEVYGDIYRHRGKYLENVHILEDVSGNNKERSEKHIDELLSFYSSKEQEIIRYILTGMFPKISSIYSYVKHYEKVEESKRRINQGEFFERYFYDYLPFSQVSAIEIRDILKGWTELSLKEKKEIIISDKYSRGLCLDIEKLPKENFKNFIKDCLDILFSDDSKYFQACSKLIIAASMKYGTNEERKNIYENVVKKIEFVLAKIFIANIGLETEENKDIIDYLNSIAQSKIKKEGG